MKRLSWRKIKKIAFDHPYFDYKPHLLSEKEADRILSAGYIDVTEFMEIVKARYERQDYDMGFVLPEPERKARLPRNKLVARLAIGVAAVLLLSAFLAFTEPGIALARVVRNFVVRIFDGSFLVQGTELPTEQPPLNTENIPDNFSSLSEAASVIGRSVIDVSDKDSILTSIRTNVINDGAMFIKTNYTWRDYTYSVTQTFYSENTLWSVGNYTDDNGVIEQTLLNGLTLYAGYMEDGASFVDAFGTGIIVSIKSTYLSREDLLKLAAEMKIIHP